MALCHRSRSVGGVCRPTQDIKLAQAAESAGWEGLFVWDHLGYVWGTPAADVWVVLAAAAAVTRRLRLGSSVTPLARRRPQVLAQTLVSLDWLSEGRLTLGVGLGGVAEEFTAFGENGEARTRAAMLDEALEILDGWLRGEKVSHHGNYYQIDDVTLLPLPVQQPRIPIWVGGDSQAALRRAAHWDGWLAGGVGLEPGMLKSPQDIASAQDYIQQQRSAAAPCEIALTGYSTPTDRLLVAEYGEAGVTWWLESLHGYRGSVAEMLERVAAGPPNG